MRKINSGILNEQLNRSKELMGLLSEQKGTVTNLKVNDVFEADINSMGNRPGYIKGKIISVDGNGFFEVSVIEVYQAPSTLVTTTKGNTTYIMRLVDGDTIEATITNPRTEEIFELDSVNKETEDWTGTTQGEEINEVTSLPTFNVNNGLLNIDNKRYKLQSEKAWTRWDIDIEDIAVEGNGDVNLTVKHPISGKSIKSQIRKVNFDKVISGAKNNDKEITVENLEGKEFFLVRV
tara:strand:- start:165 stop:869 length:705 start_codon:yes stop_codon:yes gene_type:complete